MSEMSERLEKMQEFFSAPKTPNQLAWGYSHMIMHWILTKDDSIKCDINPKSTLLEVANLAHQVGIDADITAWDK